jgi:hypothetical protein
MQTNDLTQVASFTYPAKVMLLGIVIETVPEGGSARSAGMCGHR